MKKQREHNDEIRTIEEWREENREHQKMYSRFKRQIQRNKFDKEGDKPGRTERKEDRQL